MHCAMRCKPLVLKLKRLSRSFFDEGVKDVFNAAYLYGGVDSYKEFTRNEKVVVYLYVGRWLDLGS
mgnify:CR=1 FL=1